MRLSVLTENNKQVWYHGTPDGRNINANGFSPRNTTISIIDDVDYVNELKNRVNDVEHGSKEYFDILDHIIKQQKQIKVPIPVFLTNNRQVANTYADDKRAFDYQKAEPQLYSLTVDDNNSKILTLPANGQRFSGLPKDMVIRAFVNAGIPESKIQTMMDKLPGVSNRDRVKTDDLGTLAYMLGFDIVDVIGVYDSYMGGKIPSTVRMVFDPSKISNPSKSINEDDTDKRWLWHGSYAPDSFQNIIKNGLKGQEVQGKASLDPVAGRVYMTPSIRYAIIYAIGGDIMGVKMRDGFIRPGERYGYLYQIDPTDIGDTIPDEDEIGSIMSWAYQSVNGSDYATKLIARDYPKATDKSIKRLAYMMDNYLRQVPTMAKRAIDGEVSSQAKLGKKVIRDLPPTHDIFIALKNEFDSHISVSGRVKPVAAWRFDRRLIPKLRKDVSNFFDLAKKVYER